MIRSLSLLAAASVALATPLRAEKLNMSPEELRETATHVITGNVNAVYERIETTDKWRYTRFVAELQVQECEKGDGIERGSLVYVRYWRRAWLGPISGFSTLGHRGLPSANDHIRVYLARNAYDGFTRDNNDGGYNVIGANGFEMLNADGTQLPP